MSGGKKSKVAELWFSIARKACINYSGGHTTVAKQPVVTFGTVTWSPPGFFYYRMDHPGVAHSDSALLLVWKRVHCKCTRAPPAPSLLPFPSCGWIENTHYCTMSDLQY